MWLVRDWAGISMSAAVMSPQTLVLILYGDVTVTYYGIMTFVEGETLTLAGMALMCVFQSWVGLSIISHLRCALTCPGLTPRMEPPDIPLEELKFCEKCQQWKPPRTHHCSTCHRCIHRVSSIQMDHHCPWVNNCIAVATHKYFLLFIFYFGIAGLLGAGIVGYVGYDYVFWRRRYRLKIVPLILATGGATASMFFGLLGIALMWEQLSMACNNQTTLDQWQKLQPVNVLPTQGSLLQNLSNIFGDNYWAWLLPIAPQLHTNFKEPLMSTSPKAEYNTETSTCRKAVLFLSLLMGTVGVGLAGVYFLKF